MDDFHRAMANPHRRRLLVALTDHDPQRDTLTPEDVHEGDRDLERLKIEMHHVHLPLLEDAGLIEWDRRTHEVIKGSHFDEILPMLSSADAPPDTSDDSATDTTKKCNCIP